MPLCRTCGTTVENNTKKCPHCGASPFASPEKGLSLIKRLVLVFPIACWLGSSMAERFRFFEHTDFGRQLGQTFPIDPGILFHGFPWIGGTIGFSFVLAYFLKTSLSDGKVPFGWKLISLASWMIFMAVVMLFVRALFVWATSFTDAPARTDEMNDITQFRFVMLVIFLTGVAITGYHWIQAAKSKEQISRRDEG